MTFRARAGEGIAWITGASSGIGRGVALELARRGFVVAATARREPDLANLVAEAAAFGAKISAWPADVTQAAAIEEAVTEIEASLGPVSLAFLNAGSAFGETTGEILGRAFEKTFELNVAGTAHCLRALLPRMRSRGRGQVAINASLAGYGGLPGAEAYSASKAALIALAEGLHLSQARSGIFVQVVNPGFVRTPLTDLNRNPMPFILPLDEAVRRVCDGFAGSGFEITFPRRLAWTMKAMRLLPYPLYFPLVRRITGTKSR